jgi:hypothetical protein
MIAVYGAAELPELRRQSQDYASGRATVRPLELPGHDHFSILEELARPDGRIAAEIAALQAASAA